MRTLLMIAGLGALAFGSLFALQGLGIVRWPAESFMVGQIQWAYYGTAYAIAGLIMIRLARR